MRWITAVATALVLQATLVTVFAQPNATVTSVEVSGFLQRFTVSGPPGAGGEFSHGEDFWALNTGDGATFNLNVDLQNSTELAGIYYRGSRVVGTLLLASNSSSPVIDSLREIRGAKAAGISGPQRFPRTGSVKALVVYTTICGRKPQKSFYDDTAAVQTIDDQRAVVFDATDSLASRFKQCSNGAMTLDPVGSEFVEIDVGCDYGDIGKTCAQSLMTGADNQTTAWNAYSKATIDILLERGYDPSAYRFVVFSWPKTPCNWWCGLAGLDSNLQWVNGGCFDAGILFHESGHNLGLNHALTSKQDEEVFDQISAMSGMARGRCFNLAENWALGWAAPKTLNLIGGTTLLRSLPDYLASRYAGLKIAAPSYPGYYLYLSYVASSGANTGVLDISVKDRLLVLLWNGKRGQSGFRSTERWALLAPGEAWAYDGFVIRLHTRVMKQHSAIVSICRKGGSELCNRGFTLSIKPNHKAQMGVAYRTTYGLPRFRNIVDAAQCIAKCAAEPRCGAWTVNAATKICSLHSSRAAPMTNLHAFSGILPPL